MSDRSGVSAQMISLPQDGGALHGIGEKFSPDLYTGTGNFTVPSDTPRRTAYLLSIWHEGQDEAHMWRGLIETAAQQRRRRATATPLYRLRLALSNLWLAFRTHSVPRLDPG